MSYVIHLWERPLPASLTEAAEIQSRLARLADATNPKFAVLAQQLTALHPDIDGLDDDEDGNSGVWTDGPLARNARGHLMSIGVQTHAIGSVVPLVVAHARALGLAVLDEQAGALYLPDGSAIGIRGRQRTEPAATPLASSALGRAEVRDRLRAALSPQLQAAGFSQVRGDWDYAWTTPTASFQVKFELERYYDGFKISVYLNISLPGSQPDPLLHYLYPKGAALYVHTYRLASETGLAWPAAQASFGSLTYVERLEEADQLVSNWARLYSQAILPLLRGCETLEGLEHAVNGMPQAFEAYDLGVALAAAAGRDDLEAVAAAHAPWQIDQTRQRTTRLLQTLRTPPRTELGLPAADKDLDLAALLPLLKSGRPSLPVGPDGRLRPFAYQPVITGFVGDLYVLTVAERRDTQAVESGYVQYGQLATLNGKPDSLLAQALVNLRRRAAAGLQRETAGALTRLRLDGRFDASLMLLDELWDEQLAAETPGGALVAVPQPGLLLYCDVAAPGGLPELRARVSRATVEPHDTLTRKVFYRAHKTWEVLPDPR